MNCFSLHRLGLARHTNRVLISTVWLLHCQNNTKPAQRDCSKLILSVLSIWTCSSSGFDLKRRRKVHGGGLPDDQNDESFRAPPPIFLSSGGPTQHEFSRRHCLPGSIIPFLLLCVGRSTILPGSIFPLCVSAERCSVLPRFLKRFRSEKLASYCASGMFHTTPSASRQSYLCGPNVPFFFARVSIAKPNKQASFVRMAVRNIGVHFGISEIYQLGEHFTSNTSHFTPSCHFLQRSNVKFFFAACCQLNHHSPRSDPSSVDLLAVT